MCEQTPVIVVGYGNSLRRDDGAGLILAAALVDAWTSSSLPATLIADHQLNPELAGDIAESGSRIVLFVDATAGTPDAEIETMRLEPATTGGTSPSLGHHLTPAAVMLYAQELFGYHGKGWVVTVPGYDFDHGEGLSKRTQMLIDDLMAQSSALWDELHTPSET